MHQVKRTDYCLFRISSRPDLDLAELLRGSVSIAETGMLMAESILTGQVQPLSDSDLALILRLGTDRWTAVGDNDQDYTRLARGGVVVSDSADPELTALRIRDEALAASGWDVRAAYYHFMNKWRDEDVGFDLPTTAAEAEALLGRGRAELDSFVDAAGAPPSQFDEPWNTATENLPEPALNSPLAEVLHRRKTTREYDTAMPLELDDLSTVLGAVFGAHGYMRAGDEIVSLRKTSPSGGGLHPTEAYVLALRVADVEPGLLHYRVRDHALDRIETMDASVAADLASTFTAGQDFARDAAVLFLLVTRFRRNYWKYPLHPRSYTVLNMDVAHLSQTFYLVCTELGLGAFFTAAINGWNVEERLGLDPYEHGALAICGCGHPRTEGGTLDPVYAPYVPGETIV
jgi:putative peptide maturation dehydrogenase